MDVRLIELSIKSLPEKKKNNNSNNNNDDNNNKTFVFTVSLQPWLLSAAAAPKIVIIATAINATPTSVSIPTFQQSQIKLTPCWWLNYNRQPEASISHADRTAELSPMLYTTTVIIWHEPELREPKVNGPFSNRFESKLNSSTGAGSVQRPDSPFWQNRTANG